MILHPHKTAIIAALLWLAMMLSLAYCTPAQAAMEHEEQVACAALGAKGGPACRQFVQRPRHRAQRPR